MTTASNPNNYLTHEMRQCIRGLEKNGFTVRCIVPLDPVAGIHASEFRAYLAKQTPTGLLVSSVRIDTDGNVTNPKP